jgi:uncharacterized repeat protein (TIGR01451 family)
MRDTLPLASKLARGTVRGEKDERLPAAYLRIGRDVAAVAALSLTCLSAGAQEAKRGERAEATPQAPAVAGTPTFPLNLGTLPPGKGLTVRFQAVVDDPFTGNTASVSNQGTVSGAGFGPVPTDDPDTVAVDDPTVTPVDLHPDLALVKSDGGASVAPGGTVAYTLGYTNLSAFGAPGVVLTETVPANSTFNAGASTAGWACAPNNNAGSTCTLTIGTVAGGATANATFAVTVANPVAAGVAQISNTASVASTLSDPAPANNTASDTTPVNAAPDLTLAKGDGGVSTTPGGSVSYTLDYANAGNQGAVGVVLTETVPANTTFTGTGWTCAPDNNAGSTCTRAVGALAGGGANGSAAFAVTVVSPLPAGVAQISNTASIADDGTNGPDPVPADNTATDTTPVDAAPELTIAKSDGGVSTTPGATVAYTLTFSNAGNQGAAGVTLTDVVPANATFNAAGSSAGWTCVPDNNPGSSCANPVGSVAAGAPADTRTFAVTVANPVPAGVTQLSNTATIADDGTNGPDPVPANNSSTDTTPLTAAPDLTLAKSDGGVSTTPGGTVAYSLVLTNVGTQGATGVVLTDVVPANTTFDPGASSAGWVCAPNNNAGSSCTLTVGALAGGGATTTRTYAVTVVDPIPVGVTQVSNTASVADDGTNGPDPTPANNTSSDTTPVVAAPDMTIAKSDGGTTTSPGGTVVYALAYANTGNRGASGVVLTDVVPASTTFNPGASTAGWSCTPNNNAGSSCTLAVGTVAAGGNGSASFAVTVVSPAPAGLDAVSNTATVTDDGTNGPDPNPSNNTSTDTTPVTAAPDLTLDKDDGGISTTPGGTVIYMLSYQNAGNQGAVGVVLTETVPASTTFDAGTSSPGWVCTPDVNAGSSCTLAIGAVVAAAGGTATFAVDVADPVPSGFAAVSNTASIADDGANGPDPTPADNTDTDTTPVTAAPDLAIVKSDGGASTAPGGTVLYTLSYSNGGDQGATGVVLADVVPANTTFDPASSTAGWSCTPDNNAGSACTLAVGALAGGGASGSATYAVIVDDPVPPGTTEITNTATVADDGTNGPDPTPSDNSSTDTTPLVTVPDVTVTELVHGSRLVESLASLAGPTADVDTYRIGQKPYSSYEVIVDDLAGDVATGGNGPALELLAADGTTVVQTSSAVGTGTSRALRFYNGTSAPVDDQTIRVRSAGCTTSCPAETRYRIRVYETTATFERFNNVAPQGTVVVLNNPGERSIDATVWFWDQSGALIGFSPATIPPKGTHVLNTMTVAPNASGSMTVMSNTAYGVLVGKAAVLDPVNGPVQDVNLRPRIR